MSASKHKLSNLAVFVDYNKFQSYGRTSEVMDLEPLCDKWRSFGFETTEVDGHDIPELERAMAKLPFDSSVPSALICHTVKGKGVSFTENNMEWHHKNRVTDDEIQSLLAELEAN